MTPTVLNPEDAFVPDPEDWPAPRPAEPSPEAVTNEPDDLAASLPVPAAIPPDADEADVLDQRLDVALDEEDDPRTD